MSTQPTLFMTWLWKQTPIRHDFNADKINRWAEQISKNLTIPHVLGCVTEHPEGIDSSIKIIEPPKLFENVRISAWDERAGAPQCYRRLALFHPDAKDLFGGYEWIVQSDADMIATQLLDPLFTRDYPFRIFNGTSSNRPYNGGLVMIRAGARPQVYERFAANPIKVATEARKQYVGSDQAVISYILGPGEMTWGEHDGVYYYSPRVIRLHNGMRQPPSNMRMLFFPGDVKPWNNNVKHVWMRDAWLGKPISISSHSRPKPKRLKIRAYKDSDGWGIELARAAARTGTFCTTFTRATSVNNGVAFVNLGTNGSASGHDVLLEVTKKGVLTLPTAHEALLHRDETAQAEALAKWMPRDGQLRMSDYRVCVVGRFVYGMQLSEQRPLSVTTPNDRVILSTVVEAAQELRTNWMAFDVVEVDGAPRILGLSCSWKVGAYKTCPMFAREKLKPTRRAASETFSVAVEVIKEMWRAAAA